MEACKICSKYMCFCKNKKYKATVVFRFTGKDKEDVEKRLSDFNTNVGKIKDGASIISWDCGARENHYDKDIKSEIIGLFVSLGVNYNYDEEQIQELIEDLKSEVPEAINTEIEADMADRAYDEMKDRQMEESMR